VGVPTLRVLAAAVALMIVLSGLAARAAAQSGTHAVLSPRGYQLVVPDGWEQRDPASLSANADVLLTSPDGLQRAFVFIFDEHGAGAVDPLTFVTRLASSGAADFASFTLLQGPAVAMVPNADRAAYVGYYYTDQTGVERSNQTIAAQRAGTLFVFESEALAGTSPDAPIVSGFQLTAPPSAPTAAVATPAARATPTPLPPCVDGQYAPNTAGTACRITGDTTPTALCQDGTFDYSRALTACSGHGGVARWLGPPIAASAGPAAVSTPTGASTTTLPAVSFVTVTGAPAGGMASAVAQASPGAVCTLSFLAPTATSLVTIGAATADAQGRVSWAWQVAAGTAAGNGSLLVTCQPGGSATATITIS
jgi:hypothetical protein